MDYQNIIVGMRSMPGNPYDGHTLAETIEEVSILTNRSPKTVIIDKGYRGVEIQGVQILHSGQKRGITRTLHKMIKRRSAIEPTIGHMKMDGRLDRNPLKGTLGDRYMPCSVALATTSVYCSRSCGFFAPKSGNRFWRF